tara:strand:- start:483 stop:743 length:261 start_codon:yes stop_codon:yes gene_type:complete
MKNKNLDNHISYENVTKLYKQFFSRQIEKQYESLMDNFVGEVSYYALINDRDIAELELIMERIERNTKRLLLNYQNKLITKNRELC